MLAGVVVARVAQADDSALPGTFSDPAHALELDPAIELVPVAGVPAGFAIRDADPSRVKLYVDGFEVPTLVFGGRALWFGAISHVRTFEDGVDFGYAGMTGIEVITEPYQHDRIGGAVTPMDASLVGAGPVFLGLGVVAARLSFFTPAMKRGLTLDTSLQTFNGQERIDWRLSTHWSLGASTIGMFGGPSDFARLTAAAHYDTSATKATLALSAASTSYDARAEASHTLRDVGGLSALGVFGGASASFHDDNRFDGGAWAHVIATVARSAFFIGGVRTDVFDHEAAFSPRAALGARWGATAVSVSAAASRLPQVDRDATPERATEVVARVTHRLRHASWTYDAYYIDRSRIVVDGKATGVGSAFGIEERGEWLLGPWTVYIAAALGKATRADRQTAPDHPADHDVRYRGDIAASWVHGDWRLGGRVQLRTGLPYTPVTGAIYDADTDSYTPLEGKVNGERAPWRRQLDLRVDHRFGTHVRAYLDVALDGGVLGYTYSYDYSQRLAVRAPVVLPWLGIVGNL